jgi:hypothetical protein
MLIGCLHPQRAAASSRVQNADAFTFLPDHWWNECFDRDDRESPFLSCFRFDPIAGAATHGVLSPPPTKSRGGRAFSTGCADEEGRAEFGFFGGAGGELATRRPRVSILAVVTGV